MVYIRIKPIMIAKIWHNFVLGYKKELTTRIDIKLNQNINPHLMI